MLLSLCENWEFTPQWTEQFGEGKGAGEPVRLPHTCGETPLHYADPRDYEMLCGYRRRLDLPGQLRGRRLFLQFDGAGHVATVYFNGRELLTHSCGYTAFRVEITQAVDWEGENWVALRLDSRESANVPPFGFVIDYLTYGGLYREAWLDVREESYLADVAVTTPDLTSARIAVEVEGKKDAVAKVCIRSKEGETLWQGRVGPGEGALTARVASARPWSPEEPVLYTCQVTLVGLEGEELDRQEIPFGFRTAQFRGDGFYLNGEKYFLRGLNRHQSYPYVGYAAPASLQREDARILKEELGCNIVRTSHYPQSHHFLRACDELGLLVFTEIPGWQHIGDEAWKEQACRNVREMVLQYRNHTSIILWGVRINESVDDDELYRETNRIAHQLDPSRPTSGVRYLEKSSLLEDVYAYNDFSHSGKNPGVKPKREVTSHMDKALLISECNGHMFPTKSFDSWGRRQAQAIRHARVQSDAAHSGEHAGCIGWCMFDYPTHRDFGGGDRICYHGVLDPFRNPKTAAALYGSQGEAEPVLEVGSSMDLGDYPGGRVGKVCVFSNADRVVLYKNDALVGELSRGDFPGLPHPPFVVEDTIGALLESQEGFPPEKARAIRECLLAAGEYGLAGLPLRYKAKLMKCMVKYKMSFADGVALYGKYVGNWGGESTVWRFDGVKDGETVISVVRAPSCKLHLEVRSSSGVLREGATYDMAAVRVRILDENGAVAPYAQLPVTFSLKGEGELVGPDTVTAEGGMCGTYLRSVGREGKILLTVSTPQTERVEMEFAVEKENER